MEVLIKSYISIEKTNGNNAQNSTIYFYNINQSYAMRSRRWRHKQTLNNLALYQQKEKRRISICSTISDLQP